MAMSMSMAMLSSHSLKASPLQNLSSKLFNVSSAVFASSRIKFQAKAPMNFNCLLKNDAVYEDLPAVGEDLPPDYEEWTPKKDPKDRRRAGILLHPTSFRGPHGIGDLGEETFCFLDWLHEAGCSVWQVLPLVPPGRKGNEDGSPYAGQDANCGNTLLISLEELVKDGLLMKEELPKPVDADRVDFSTVADIKDPLIAKAAERLILSEGELKNHFEDFRRDPEISKAVTFLYFLDEGISYRLGYGCQSESGFCFDLKLSKNSTFFNWNYDLESPPQALFYHVGLKKSELIPVGIILNVEEFVAELSCRKEDLPTIYLGLLLEAPISQGLVGIQWKSGSTRCWLCEKGSTFLRVGDSLSSNNTLSSLPIYHMSPFVMSMKAGENWGFILKYESLWKWVIVGKYGKKEWGWSYQESRVDFGVESLKVERVEAFILRLKVKVVNRDVEDKMDWMDAKKYWLEDSAYFAAIDETLNTISWYDWPEPLKNRHLSALEEIYQSKRDFINIFIAQQFLFQRQWQKVRNYAQMKGIKIMGDMPIYVGYHSADVWANKKHFLLNKSGFPLLVSGVPPDAFSETGQLWGRTLVKLLSGLWMRTSSRSPLYDWKAMERDRFSWWIRRIRRAQNIYDEFRIDHFRGFAGYWAVPSEAKFAMDGQWKMGPGKSLFDAIFRAVGKINIVAEDLGVITEDVIQLRKYIRAPGMAVLQFGFGSDADNPHLPHNHEQNEVVYTGTHDNDTTRGWWDILEQEEKSNVLKYVTVTGEDDISWALIQAALSSVAQTAIIPMQDVLGLGNSARMNIPATQSWSGFGRFVEGKPLGSNQILG
ncbi:4-alpha-glucanotransferase, chloroplastic/amyloplastic [Vitis vinifera]|uniref:4-alpha-glucanotransferase n=1 Tax=Vitis vinifera TaxID=29760 RepID=A0A438KJZ0_VITVI|nr:4-alpha-glucanotransferase, chloroplastic/amyloplastic [Vitis vinifera]